MLMIPSRGQCLACEGLALPDQLVNRSLQFVQFATFFLFAPALEIPLIALYGFHSGDEAGAFTTPPVFRCHPAISPNGSVDVGSATPMNDGHVYYAFRDAPLRGR
jgi:hypothetical protein